MASNYNMHHLTKQESDPDEQETLLIAPPRRFRQTSSVIGQKANGDRRYSLGFKVSYPRRRQHYKSSPPR